MFINDVQKFFMTSKTGLATKICQKFVMKSEIRHDVKKFVMKSKHVMTSESSLCRQNVKRPS